MTGPRTRRRALVVIAGMVLAASGWVGAQESSPRTGRIVRRDFRLDRLIPPEARLEKLADGFTWVEGPAWNRREGYLLPHPPERGLPVAGE